MSISQARPDVGIHNRRNQDVKARKRGEKNRERKPNVVANNEAELKVDSFG